MNTMELTEEMEFGSKPGQKTGGFTSKIPAWLKVVAYTVLGAATYKGLIITYDEVKKALIKAKYTFVADVVSESLDGKKVWLDNKTNKQGFVSDMSQSQLEMAIYATTLRLESCEATLQTINGMSNNIEVVK